ncbi:hypothetical protein [Novacetimonas hansenii]|uniref:hypothetical protein n=1 Tax=Novacetimonas hansenii TaxID=436 RepID=UPI00117B676B|nr:hypothetical protein [Novacetimonas hansenii]
MMVLFAQNHLHTPAQHTHAAGKRLFENTSLIKNRKSFWVPPFDRKRRRLSKLSGKSFTKNLYHFSMLSRLTFQTVSKHLLQLAHFITRQVEPAGLQVPFNLDIANDGPRQGRHMIGRWRGHMPG